MNDEFSGLDWQPDPDAREKARDEKGRQARAALRAAQIKRARHIARTLGTFRAARFLWKRGWSFQAASWILLGK